MAVPMRELQAVAADIHNDIAHGLLWPATTFAGRLAAA